MCSIAKNQASAVRSAPRALHFTLNQVLATLPHWGGRFKLSLLHQGADQFGDERALVDGNEQYSRVVDAVSQIAKHSNYQ